MPDQPASLAAALAELQTKLPHIGKDADAQYGKYADLAAITRKIMPVLGKLGLSFMARPTMDGDRFVLAYELRHVSDEVGIGGTYPLPGMEKGPQALGSAITYARRYCLCAVTGVAPDDSSDDDGEAAEAAESSSSGGRWMNRRMDVPPADLPRTPTKTTGADHEQLRDGALEAAPGDRPSKRGRTPNGQDPWQDAEPGEFEPTETSLPPRTRKPATPAQLIAAHFKRLGITEDDERHNWVARMAGRTELASTTNLPAEQQQEILSALAHCKDIGQVQAWIDDKAPAS